MRNHRTIVGNVVKGGADTLVQQYALRIRKGADEGTEEEGCACTVQVRGSMVAWQGVRSVGGTVPSIHSGIHTRLDQSAHSIVKKRLRVTVSQRCERVAKDTTFLCSYLL